MKINKSTPTLKTKNHQWKQQPFFLMGLFLILLTGCGGIAPTATSDPSAAGANSVVIATFTASPTNAPAQALETSLPTITPASDAKTMGQLPGLSPRNVTVRLEEQQFTCTSVKKGTVYYERSCSRGVPGVQVFYVAISGRESFVVDFIEASILQPENPDQKIAISILGLIASMPYDGATPEDARSWVENTIPVLSSDPSETQEKVFGGVKYVLYGPPTKLTLEIGELP